LDEVSGSREVGKEADMIVVDRNILACPSEDVGLAQVERTIFRGQTLYQK
jgi:predicted amidohydrolase YtcJ